MTHGRNYRGTDTWTGKPYRKQRWGSHPKHENKPGASASERNYIAAAQKAAAMGRTAALDTTKSERDCPFHDDRKDLLAKRIPARPVDLKVNASHHRAMTYHEPTRICW